MDQMNTTPINFDDSLYDDTVNGMSYKLYCNKSFKPTAFDMSFDTLIEPNDVWFIKRDFLPEFFSVLPIDCPPITVVTQHSDIEVDDEIMKAKPACVKKVFGSNTTSLREDSIPIPLGIGPPYCHFTPKINEIRAVDAKKQRSRLLYVNFRTTFLSDENRGIREYARQKVLEMSRSCSAVVTIIDASIQPVSNQQYLEDLTDHKFCLCPRGGGIDTHRLWECLYCRTIPIVKRENAHRNFTDLPILFVEDWSEITEEFLHDSYQRFFDVDWNYSKLSASWWGRKFRE